MNDPTHDNLFWSTSTPHRPYVKQDQVQNTLDTGYYTNDSINDRNPQSSDGSHFLSSSLLSRPSFRGKPRFDIVTALLTFDPSLMLVERILALIPFANRYVLLRVCKSWQSLRTNLPRLFDPKLEPVREVDLENKENRPLPKLSSFAPLPPPAPIHEDDPSLLDDYCSVVCSQNDRIKLLPCPACSHLAFYQPNRLPRRLYCQSGLCGLSLCYSCRREHSPSVGCSVDDVDGRCSTPPPLSRLHSPDASIPSSPVRSPRTKVRVRRMALKRL